MKNERLKDGEFKILKHLARALVCVGTWRQIEPSGVQLLPSARTQTRPNRTRVPSDLAAMRAFDFTSNETP